MRHTEMSWQALDGTRLFAQSWEPENKRGVVCLVHGLGEHSSRYSHFAAVFNQAGFAVVTLDLRGHGKSGGARGHTPSFEHYMDDLQLLLADAEHRCPGAPCFLYGHSMGGLLALSYVLRRQPRLSGVVIASAGLRSALEKQSGKVLAVHLLGSILPQLSQHSGLNSTMLSRDPKVVEQYRNDPLVHDRISLGMAKGCLEAVKYAFAHAAKFSVPLLVLHGAADELTFPSGSAALASLVARDCTLKIWDGLYHELHNEPEKEAVFRYVLTWLEAKGSKRDGAFCFKPHRCTEIATPTKGGASMFDCPSCGSRIDDVRKHYCGTCGTHLRPEASPLMSGQEGLSVEEKAGICVGNICLSPLLGTVLYFVWKNDKPAKANDVCMVTIASLFVGPLIAFILFLLGIVGGGR